MELKIAAEITAEDAVSLMGDPKIAAAIEAFQRRNVFPAYPRRWGAATSHKYKELSSNNGWKESVWVELPKYGLAYKICADCGTHVWIRIGDEQKEFSMRQSDYVNLTPDLQVKPMRTILKIRRPHFMPESGHCQAAAD